MELISYDGFAFADLDMWGGFDAGAYRGNWQINARYAPRVGAPGVLGPGEIAPTTIEATIGWDGDDSGDDLLLVFDRMVGRLNPMDQSPKRTLVVDRPDGTRVWRYANVVVSGMPDPDGGVNTLAVRFTSADPVWRKEEPRVVLPSVPLAQVVGTHSAISLPNAGQAAVHPVYTVVWDGTERANVDKTSSIGWSKRWTLGITNTRPNTVPPWPYWINLGNTAALVTAATARADGNDLRVLHQGAQIGRNLVGWNEAQSYALVLLPRMEAGQTIELDIVYDNSAAGAPMTLSYPNLPACQTEWHAGAALTGSTTTQLNATEATGLTRALALGGQVRGLTGPNAGATRDIAGFVTAGGVTNVFTGAFAAAWGTGDRYLILSSFRDRLLWNTAVTDRPSNTSRGRWYLNDGQNQPDVVDYRVPCAWRPVLYQDGRDKKGQRRYSYLTIAGSNVDSFALLDVSRTWENGPSVSEEGTGDGVGLSLPFPIPAYRWQGKRTNPSGMCKAIVASRGQGGEQYRELASIATHAATETTWDPGTLTCPTDTLHLYTGLIPAEGDEIPPDWRSDQGETTATAAGATSLVDGEKDWIAGQWIGATARITSGKNRSRSRIVTDNTATTVSWATALDHDVYAGNTYELRHKPLKSTLRDFIECNVDVDISALVATGSAANVEAVHHHRGQLWIGDGYRETPTRRGQVTIGSGTDWVLTTEDETIVLDSGKRTAEIRLASDGSVVRRLAEPIVQWTSITTEDGITEERRSLDGMPLPIGANPLENPGADVDADTVTLEVSGGATASVVRTTSLPTPYEGAGQFRVLILSNPGGGSAWAQAVWPAVACRSGDLVEVAAALYTSSDLLVPTLGVRWLDAVGDPISTSLQAAYTPAEDTWLAIGEDYTAPALAAAFEPLVRVTPTGTATGSVYVDAFDPGSPVLWYDEHASAGIRIGATYTEGFLG